MNTEQKHEFHLAIYTKLEDIFLSKNHDYGDAYAEVREECNDAILVHIYEKYKRLKTLMKLGEENAKVNESIDDTLIDVANFCIMELTERHAKQESVYNETKRKVEETYGKTPHKLTRQEMQISKDFIDKELSYRAKEKEVEQCQFATDFESRTTVLSELTEKFQRYQNEPMTDKEMKQDIEDRADFEIKP